MSGRAVVSVHDVEPASLPGVREVMEVLEAAGVRPVTLLVVPGADWDRASLDAVRELVDRGCGVAGHGWCHHAPPPSGIGHRIHAALISRDQAEHLSRPPGELVDLVSRCHAWFPTVGLPSPEVYVPPAWALGRLARGDLAALPFRWYEVLGGCVSADDGALCALPLVGYEADTRIRAAALRATNGLNRAVGRVTGRPVRIAIHPRDLRLRLAHRVREMMRRQWRYTTLEAVMRELTGVGAGP